MLCNWSSFYSSVDYVLTNLKTFHRFEKYLPFDYQVEEYHYLKNFLKQLDLTPRSMRTINENLSANKFHLNPRVNRDINLILKRSFHSYRSTTPANPIDMEKIKVDNDLEKKSESLKKMLSNYSMKPTVQLQILQAYLLGFERSVVLASQNQKGKISYFNPLYFVLLLLAYLWYDRSGAKSMGVNGSQIAKFFSKSLFENGATFISKMDIKFDDVQGCDEVKKQLQDVVSFLKNPSSFSSVGAQLPKGVLLSGPPGVGKTLLAKAVAGEAGVSFLYISGSQFDEMFVGVGASRMRSLFNDARENSPCVVFIDELDAVCSKRTSSSIHPYANQTINQLLAEMDGFVENEGIIVIGATNRVDSLDKAVLRPGRFDLKIPVYLPDYKGRLALFKLYLSKVVTDENIDFPALAKSTIGSSGADIKNMVNHAAIICGLKHDLAINMSHLWESQMKLIMGAARSRPTQESDCIITAYHEAGHAIVTYFTPNSSNNVKLVSIIPRGPTGGHTSFIPKLETTHQSKVQLMASIDGLMGGRAAEEILNGPDNIHTGISDDMKRATELARVMVTRLTMSDEIGLQVFDTTESSHKSPLISQQTLEKVDTEVNRILKESYDRAKSILQERNTEWQALAKYLLKYETIEGEDVELIIKGKKPKVEIAAEEIINKKNKSNTDNSTSTQLFGLFSNRNAKK